MTEISYPCRVCGAQKLQNDGEKDGYALYLCPVCDFLGVYPVPSPDELAKVYSNTYYKNDGEASFGYANYDKDKEPMRPIFEMYLERLGKLVSGKSIFDIGAATGYFLDIARGLGWKTYGSEISVYAVGEARARGHNMTLGSLVGAKQLPVVDVITAWDVFEHVDDPVSYMHVANSMLTMGGVLAINTVDRSSLFARLLGKRWHLMIPPEHLNYFSPKNLRLLLESQGFDVLEFRKIGKSFSPAYIFKTLASWQGLALWSWCARMTDNAFFRFFSIPINLRDNVFVLARKIHDVDTH